MELQSLRDVPDAHPPDVLGLNPAPCITQRSQAVVEFRHVAITFTLIMFAIADLVCC